MTWGDLTWPISYSFVNCKSYVLTINISIERTVHIRRTYVKCTLIARGACESSVHTIFIKKKLLWRKIPVRIRELSIHQNQIKNSSNPLVKTKINQTKTFYTKNMEGKEEKEDQKKLNIAVDCRKMHNIPNHFDLRACDYRNIY